MKPVAHMNVKFIITIIFLEYISENCHGLLQKTMSFNKVAIVSVKVNTYRIYIYIYIYVERNIKSCTCCYLEDLININDVDLESIITNEKPCDNIFCCNLHTMSSVYMLSLIK